MQQNRSTVLYCNQVIVVLVEVAKLWRKLRKSKDVKKRKMCVYRIVEAET